MVSMESAFPWASLGNGQSSGQEENLWSQKEFEWQPFQMQYFPLDLKRFNMHTFVTVFTFPAATAVQEDIYLISV